MKDRTYILTSFAALEENNPGELESLQRVFGKEHVIEHLYELPSGSVVIPRFRALPFGDLLEAEIKHNGSKLINSYQEHRNIADSRTWSYLLEGMTPKQFVVSDIPYLPEGEYFVKGETNSRKNDWFGSSYAATKKDLLRVVRNLQQDSMISSQEIIIKPFQKFRKIAESVTGQPIFHERRVFILDGKIISEAPYWSSFIEAYEGIKYNEEKYYELLNRAIEATKHLARFYVIDLAEYSDGEWSVVELNDGSMSGLSENNPDKLWSAVKEHLEAF